MDNHNSDNTCIEYTNFFNHYIDIRYISRYPQNYETYVYFLLSKKNV